MVASSIYLHKSVKRKSSLIFKVSFILLVIVLFVISIGDLYISMYVNSKEISTNTHYLISIFSSIVSTIILFIGCLGFLVTARSIGKK